MVLPQGGGHLFQGGVLPPTGWLDKPLEVRRLTEQPLLTSIVQKTRLVLFGHLIRMDESADARRILTAVLQSDWRRPVGRPHSSWMATLRIA